MTGSTPPSLLACLQELGGAVGMTGVPGDLRGQVVVVARAAALGLLLQLGVELVQGAVATVHTDQPAYQRGIVGMAAELLFDLAHHARDRTRCG